MLGVHAFSLSLEQICSRLHRTTQCQLKTVQSACAPQKYGSQIVPPEPTMFTTQTLLLLYAIFHSCLLTQLHTFSPEKRKYFGFCPTNYGFLPFFFRATAGNLGLTTPLILQSRHPDLQEVNVSAFSDLPYSTYCLAENLAFRSIKLFPLPATTIFLWWITRLDLLRS